MKRRTLFSGSGGVLLLLFLLSWSVLAQRLPDGSSTCEHTRIRAFGQGLFQNRSGRVMYPGDDRIDVTYYRLDLHITYTPPFLRGAVTVGLRSTTDSLNRFFLDLSDTLRVDSVKAGVVRLTFTHIRNRLEISPATSIKKGESLAVTVYYGGRPARGSGLGGFSFSSHGPQRDPVIATLSQPYDARNWFPCKDTPGDKADSCDVSIRASRNFVSVSNGRLEGITDHTDSTRTYRWSHRYPIAHYLISLAMSNYVRLDQTYRPAAGPAMPIWHYLYPEQVTDALVRNVNETPRMLDIFTPYFGPYPFLREKYGHASFNFGGAMEHQTISSMGTYNLNVIAHELAHQWFGDKITARSWEHIWLHEGFASYAEALYQEGANGRAAYQTTMDAFMNRALRAQGSIYVQDISSVASIFDGNRTYAKGAVVLHMLRGVVGDRTFQEIIRGYANSLLSYKTAVIEDFQGIANQVYGRPLDYFFKQWIYGENFPTYRLTWQTTGPNASGQWGLQLRLQQTTGTNNPAFFTMPIQFGIRLGEPGTVQRDTVVTFFNNSADQTFSLDVPGQPVAVEVDPNNRILKRVELTDVITTTPTPIVSPSLRVQPNPVIDELTVEIRLPNSLRGRLSLFDLLGREVMTTPEQTFISGIQRMTFPVGHLPTGRYTLSLRDATRRLTTVVLIAR